MSREGSSDRILHAVRRACAGAPTPDALFEAAAERIAETVPHDGAMWFGTDPATLLATSPARFENLDGGYCETFWHGEFHSPDVALFRNLARDPSPAAALRMVTGDRPIRSARYRDFLRPQGYEDEIRIVFRTGDSTWAMAALFRDTGRPPFDQADVALMAAMSEVIGAAVRSRSTLAPAVHGASRAPGLLVFRPDGLLLSANAEADAWLEDIYGSSAGDGPSWVRVLATPSGADILSPYATLVPLLEHARAVSAGFEDGPARMRLRDRSGRWLVLHASCLTGADESVAVVVEPAKSAEIAPIVIEAYGVSPRERDVVHAIARGLSTPEIAAELFLSAHTVRDYIKSIFEKTGVSSRGELVAKLFAEHYSDAMHATAVHVG